MNPTVDSPQERDDKADALARDVRRFKIETRFLYVLACGLAAFAGFLSAELREVQRQQIEGRRLGSGVTCAFGGAIANAGRQVLMSAPEPQTPDQKRFEAFLVRNGYPPFAERQAAAKVAGRLYVASIAAEVEKQTGLRSVVVKKGPRAGTLDCDRLQRVTAIKR